MPFRIRKKLIAALFCFPLLIVGCSNSDSDPEAPTKIGVFIDAPVKGLGYSNTPSGIMGVTNEKGEYSFKEGDKVTFFIKGISIGQVDATPETPVTNLAKSTIVARILQSLDTESNNPDLIDISKISIPAEIQQDLSNIIASSENARALDTQLTSALSPENLKIIEDASIVDSGDEEIDLVDTLVTESAALDHINAAGILVDFTAADLVGQAFFLEDDEGEFSTIYFLDGVAYKFDHPASEQGQATKDEVSWVIDGGKLIMTATIGDTTEVDTVTLRSIDGNRYLTSVVESDDPNSIFAVTFNKVQLLTPASLGSKILKRLDSSSCNERTIEFSDDGTTGTVKSLCGDDSEYRESTISVSSVPELENVIAFSGEDGDGPFTAHLSLIDGTFEVGSQLRFSLTSDKNSVDNIDAKVDMYEVVTEAVQAPVVPSGGFALVDISRQVYTRSSGAVIVAFFENNTGTETNSGTESSEDKYATDFTWAIDNGFLLLDYPGDADDVSVELTGVSGDIHSVIVTEVDGAVNGTIYKSKALSPADLNNKILALTDPSENVNCAERTIKFSTQDGVLKADMRERCGGEYFASPGFIVTADSNLDNVVKLNLPDSDGVAYITLVSGDLSTPATVTLGSIFYKSENDLEAVEIESYSLVENELVAPIVGPAFDASNIARQVYLDVDKQEMMVFENESIGALYENVDSGTNGDTNGVKHPFTWSVVEGTLNVDFTDESITDISATLESVEGNVYQVKVISHDGQPVIELKRAMPLAVSDLDGLIIADSSNVSCPGSISITGLSAVRKEVCISEGNDYHEFNMDLSQVPEFDNVIKFTINDSDSENANEVYFTLVGGSIANEVMTFAAIFDPNETEVGEVEVFDYIVTDQEVQQPEPTGEVPTVVGVPVFLQNGSSASITVKFSEDMQDTYNTSGSYVPTNSYWSDSRTFVVEFSSFTPGQTITFNTDGFETVGGKEIAQPYVFTFPEDLTAALPISEVDLSKQTYVSINEEMVLSFGSDGRGVEFNAGNDGVAYANDFSWSIVDGRMVNAYDEPEGGSVTVEAVNVSENVYAVKTGVNANNLIGTAIFHKALPLSISDVNGKIISLDMSQDNDCSEMTFAFSQNSINLVEVCNDVTGGIKTRSYDLVESSTLDNVLVMNNAPGSDDAIELSMMLIDGSIAIGGKVVFVVKKNGVMHDVATHDFVEVDEEASLPVTTTTTTNAETGAVTTTTTTNNSDGSSTVVTSTTNPDGTTFGVTTTVNPDGSTTSSPTNETITTTNPDDGSTTVVTSTTNSDGTVTVVSTTTNPDGSTSTITSVANQDGTVTTTYPDGTSTTTMTGFSVDYLSSNPWYVVASDGDCFAKLVYDADGINGQAFFIGENGQPQSDSFTYAIDSVGNMMINGSGGQNHYEFSEAIDTKFKAVDTFTASSSREDYTANISGFASYAEAISYANEKGNANCANYLIQ